ncbi:MAG: hypothetical protein V1720_08200 [bacterium]
MNRKICLILILILSSIDVATAQTDSTNRLDFSDKKFYSSAYWASFCFGKNYFGPTIGWNINYAFENNILSIHFLKADEIQLSVEGSYDFYDPPLSYKETALLYGKSYRKEFLTLSAAGGIAFVNATDRGQKIEGNKYEKVSISTIGFPFEVKFRYEFGQTIGIGGTWFGNLNGKKSFTGGMLEISIGNFI